MTYVAGVFAIRAAVTFVAAHTLPMKSIGSQGDILGVRSVFFCKRTAWNFVMATQASFIIREILLMLSPELFIKGHRVAGTAGDRLILTYFIMVTVRALIAELICMGEMGEDNPPAVVIHDHADRAFLLCKREEESGYCREDTGSNNQGYGNISVLQRINP